MKTLQRFTLAVSVAGSLVLTSCQTEVPDAVESPPPTSSEAAAPTNRIDIPEAVVRNLGITFARVELRAVASTLRMPGQFELEPTARREYVAPLPGRVELLVREFDRVETGDALVRIASAEWVQLHESIDLLTAQIAAFEQVRQAHAQHRQALTERVALWRGRLGQLEEVRTAGGATVSQLTEVRAALNDAESALAEVLEKDAELGSDSTRAESERRALSIRRDFLEAATNEREGNADQPQGGDPGTNMSYCMYATEPGVVQELHVTQGSLVTEGAELITIVRPRALRFIGRGLQSDVGVLRSGLQARIVPQGLELGGSSKPMLGPLELGPTADSESRTLAVVVRPSEIAEWARAGVTALVEVTLEGGTDELAIPTSAVVRDGTAALYFRRDPKDKNKVIRTEADLGLTDGRWVVVASGVKEGDEVVVGGNYQLMLASSGAAPKGGHFHADGTFHEGKD